MPEFRYVARKANGSLFDGTLNCDDRAMAIVEVERQGATPIRIDPVRLANGTATIAKAQVKKAAGPQPVSQTLPHTQLYLFTEQLAHLLSAGMTLDEALGILVKRLKEPRLQALSQTLHQGLLDGRSLSQSMRDFPRIFSPLYLNMVSAGEVSGALSDILRRLVVHLADVKALRDRVQQALIYPALLVVAGIGLVIIFMTVMVPKLTGFFSQTNQPLPTPTRILLETNTLLTHYWWAGVLVLGACYAGAKVFKRTDEGRTAWDAFVWRFPIFSMVLRYQYYAQFARTLGTLIENGVTLLRALELLEEISGNEFVRKKMAEVRRAIVDGATLSVALGEQKIFPELFVDMMSVGEQTGKFGETMLMIADVYERELDKQVNIISTLIPPLIMLVIATIVGFVVFGILSAVFGLTANLRTGIH